MIDLFRTEEQSVIVVGIHAKIIQSILDFDYVRGVSCPSVIAVIGGSTRSHKCWFGNKEILLPVYKNIELAKKNEVEANWLLNISSANSARQTSESFFKHYPEAYGAHIFAENVSEQDALFMVENFGDKKLIAGPSGVGLLVPGALKLGAIGGIYGNNIKSLAGKSGDTAVICSSGGMVNEIVDTVLRSGGVPSFAVSYGGERFPVTSPLKWFMEAENDPVTKRIIYFGELGGRDEYELALAINKKEITKPVFAYIAGHYETTNERLQFGHAKALADDPDESAAAKMKVLAKSGVIVADTFGEFIDKINNFPYDTVVNQLAKGWNPPEEFRSPSLFTATKDKGVDKKTFVEHSLCNLLEQDEVSDVMIGFTELVYSLLVDNGAEVSGAVNTMVTARAGRDMGTSLASGVLTVGDRFGGAINGAAKNWFYSVNDSVEVDTMLENHKSKGEYVMGIGHLKHSLHNPDYRVAELVSFARKKLSMTPYLDYAESVARRTTQKRSNLIMNVDGAVAAIALDILIEKEKYSKLQIEELLKIEFFNSYFLIPRTVGFIGNYLSQKRRDEGLFRLSSDQVFYD